MYNIFININNNSLNLFSNIKYIMETEQTQSTKTDNEIKEIKTEIKDLQNSVKELNNKLQDLEFCIKQFIDMLSTPSYEEDDNDNDEYEGEDEGEDEGDL